MSVDFVLSAEQRRNIRNLVVGLGYEIRSFRQRKDAFSCCYLIAVKGYNFKIMVWRKEDMETLVVSIDTYNESDYEHYLSRYSFIEQSKELKAFFEDNLVIKAVQEVQKANKQGHLVKLKVLNITLAKGTFEEETLPNISLCCSLGYKLTDIQRASVNINFYKSKEPNKAEYISDNQELVIRKDSFRYLPKCKHTQLRKMEDTSIDKENMEELKKNVFFHFIYINSFIKSNFKSFDTFCFDTESYEQCQLYLDQHLALEDMMAV